jgi:hypothetical protein
VLAAALASLTLTGTPPVLTGAHFRPHELVRVLVASPSRKLEVRASARGTFTVRLGASPARRGFVVQAFGALGSRATVAVGVPTGAGSGLAKPADPTK